jgi:hypothetical protein
LVLLNTQPTSERVNILVEERAVELRYLRLPPQEFNHIAKKLIFRKKQVRRKVERRTEKKKKRRNLLVEV